MTDAVSARLDTAHVKDQSKIVNRELVEHGEIVYKVKWKQDSSLALRRSCAHGICGSDAMIVNGVNRLACKVLIKDLSQPITVEPIKGLPHIKDFIVDMEPFFAGYKEVKPWLTVDEDEKEPHRERIQSPEDRCLLYTSPSPRD